MTRAILLAISCLVGCARPTVAPSSPSSTGSAAIAPRREPGPEERPTELPVAVAPEAVPPAPEIAPPIDAAEALLRPLSEAEADLLFASPQDEPPERRGGVTAERFDKHYIAGNEKALHAFYASIVGIGGGYLGVGSDQAYLLMGWARPEIAWLADYDPDVVDVHEIYRLCILASETPDELLLLWDKPGRVRVHGLIDAEHPNARGRHLKGLYGRNRGWINRRLVAQRARLRELDLPSWLTDQASYDYVRGMLEARRVRPLLANLLDARGIAGVGETARALGVPIRVLYLSNAEEYWPRYTARFRENLAALPFDGDAVVLRTLLIWDVNEDYRYNVQRADNYLSWLQRGFVKNVYDVVHDRPQPSKDALNFFETSGDPDRSPAFRRQQNAATTGKKRG